MPNCEMFQEEIKNWFFENKMKEKTMFLKLFSFYLLIFVFIAILSSCNLFGPPHPPQDATQYLENNGIDANIIKRIIDRNMLTKDEYKKFSVSNNENVRFMIATNPHTPIDILSELTNDKSDIVLQGVLRNNRLPVKELKKQLIHKHLLKYLVGNQNLPETTILEIYDKNKTIPLVYFAMNPKCPERIKTIILNSGDFLAKRYLENSLQKQ